MKRISYWIRNYFGFSKTETKGFVIIIIFMFFILISPFLLNTFFPDKILNNNNQEILDELLADIDKNTSAKKQNLLTKNDKLFRKQQTSTSYTLFNFDPNTANKQELESLGLKVYIVKNILKYRSKGGFFTTKEKFAQVYGLSEKKYKELEPYIQIVQKTKKKKKYKEEEFVTNKKKERKKYTSARVSPFDINEASIEQLKQVKGIGDYYAKKIIKFREALGGFYTPEQVKETYQLPEETATELLKYMTFDSPKLKKNSINKADAKTLAKHPYINWNLANAIVKYRKQHGSFKEIEDLTKIKILSTDKFHKLKHYLEL